MLIGLVCVWILSLKLLSLMTCGSSDSSKKCRIVSLIISAIHHHQRRKVEDDNAWQQKDLLHEIVASSCAKLWLGHTPSDKRQGPSCSKIMIDKFHHA